MMYAKLIEGEVVMYVKPDGVLCEDPTLRGYKELITKLGGGGTYETDSQIIVEIDVNDAN